MAVLGLKPQDGFLSVLFGFGQFRYLHKDRFVGLSNSPSRARAVPSSKGKTTRHLI